MKAMYEGRKERKQEKEEREKMTIKKIKVQENEC